MKLLRLREVCEKVGFKRTSVYNMVKEGLFPPPIKRGRASLWVEEEIESVIKLWIGNAPDDEVRHVVKAVVERRPAC